MRRGVAAHTRTEKEKERRKEGGREREEKEEEEEPAPKRSYERVREINGTPREASKSQ